MNAAEKAIFMQIFSLIIKMISVFSNAFSFLRVVVNELDRVRYEYDVLLFFFYASRSLEGSSSVPHCSVVFL